MPGKLIIDLSYSPAAFLYRATDPLVVIDGVEQSRDGWGIRSFELPPGLHKVDVHVPYVLPRRAGKATLEVAVPVDGAVEIQYMAPTITVARGSLGTPGEQKSFGASMVQKANVVAIVVAVLIVIAMFVFE